MALNYVLYFLTSSNGKFFQAVSCDLPPVQTTKQLWNTPYRDLSAGGQQTISTSPLLAETVITKGTPDTAAIVTATVSTGTQSYSDDVTHTGFRQDPQYNSDWWIFTDSLGRLCGAAPLSAWPSWNNTAAPNVAPSSPAVSPH
jgi:hypothetical protein